MPKSLKQQAYNAIREKILNCEYPPNTFLNEDLLCREFNVSRTPIRDALSRLEQENLVTIISKKGIMVAPLTLNEINTIYETRILLEPYILSTYGSRITESKLQQMQDNIKKAEKKLDQIQELYLLDDEFHRMIVEICENKYLIQCYSNIYAQNLRLRIISGNDNKDRRSASCQEHKMITDAILSKDYEQSANAMRTHLLESKEAAFKVIMNGNIHIN